MTAIKNKILPVARLFGVVFLCFLAQFAFAQQRVTGTVSDNTASVGLPGVNVSIKGTSTGTTTNGSGQYTLDVPSGATLVYSFIGKLRQEIAVGNRSVIDVTLTDDATALGEVVVIGYGTTKKKDLTGSVLAITETDFVKGNVTTADQLIVGKMAGVQITPGGGAPGSGSTIRIRGGSSLNASNDPLIVIDGVPIDNSSVSGVANPLSFINPNDIESFNVLKDASASAIYGSRAANGVIIITTKKGKKGGPLKVSFDTRYAMAQNIQQVGVLSADEFREAVATYGTAAQKALLGTANTNWQDEIFRNAATIDNNLSLTGSIKNIPFRTSVGFLNQNGTLKTSNLKRTSASLGLSPSFLDKHLAIDLNVKYANSKSQFADEGAIGTAIGFDPTQPVHASNEFGGYFQWLNPNGSGIEALATSNPLAMLELRDNLGSINRTIANVSATYTFHGMPFLKAVVNTGFDRSNTDGTDNVSKLISATSFNNGGTVNTYTQNRNNKTFQAYLNYTKTFGKQNLDLMGGYEYQGFVRENENELVFGNPNIPARPNYFKTEYRLGSQFGRLNYSLNDRYLATVTLRRDGTSRFSENNRFGLFPSVALAWKLNDQFGLTNQLSDLKLRLGYGVTGQQDINSGDYPYLAAYTPGQGLKYQFGNTYYDVLRPNPYDANIKWEETASSNIGLDFGIKALRLSGSVDVYQKNTKDLINEIDAPAGTNFSNKVTTNIGTMTNKGVELNLNYSPILKKNLTWDINFNITRNRNEITALTRNADPNFIGVLVGGIGGGTGSLGQIHSTGYPRASYFLYQQVYDQTGKPLEAVFVDRNADGVVSELDRYRYQNPDPKYYMGLSSNVTVKNFSLGFIMRANVGNYVFNNVQSGQSSFASMTGAGNFIFNLNENVRNTGFKNTTRREQILLSDLFVENASFLKIDNINLGYDLANVLKQSKVKARLNLVAQNVLMHTKYTGLDPEVQGGIDRNIYPRPRTYSLNLNLNF
jgi:TonB-dependent starch-binding outer membrane protein SusC